MCQMYAAVKQVIAVLIIASNRELRLFYLRVLLARLTASNERSGLRIWRVVACMLIKASQQKSGFETVNVSDGKYTAAYHMLLL